MKTALIFAITNTIKSLIKICLAIFLSAFFVNVSAEAIIKDLQKNASITYEQMIQAKRSAEDLAKDAAFAEKRLSSIKQKLSEAERELEITRKSAEQARILMEEAIKRWKQASDTLANEWGKGEIIK